MQFKLKPAFKQFSVLTSCALFEYAISSIMDTLLNLISRHL